MNTGRYSDSPRGFTLLELLVVLAIAGLLMLAVPPMISAALPGTQLKSAARELAVTLREAHFNAVSRGELVAISFSTAAPHYSLGKDQVHTLPRDTTLQIASLPTSHYSDDFQLLFYPDGSSSGARIVLAREQQRYVLSVGWLMGRVRIGVDDDDVY